MMNPRSSDEARKRDIPSFIEPRPPLIYNPFMRPRPEKGVNLLEKFEEDSNIEEPELVQVYLRMKPCKIPNNLYELRSDKCLVTSLDTTTAGHGRRTQHNVSKMYTFSRIFKAETGQSEVFELVVKNNLRRLVDGYSFTLLTYGASGSGKTYTVMGTVNSPGLVPRALEYLFKLVDAAQTPIIKPSDNGTDILNNFQQDAELQWVKRLLQISAPFRDKYRRMSTQLHRDFTVSCVDLTNRTKYYVWVSFVEIYNEAIYDLLATPEKRVKLRLREDSAGNVYVKGVTQTFVRSGEEAYNVMVAGKHNLVVAATGIHAHSSRSHCIFTITMLTEKDGEIRTSHVRLCDLAGCERQSATRNTGVRMQESRAINSSLHVLERCLHMLRRKQHTKESAMIPYRECKLTRLLGSGLSGARGEAVSMVVTINPAPQYAQETRHVLSLAVVAKDIQINSTVDPTVLTLSSLESTQDSTVHDYSDEIMRLRTENERLHFELVQAQSCISQLHRSMEENKQESAITMSELVESAKSMMRDYYEKRLAELKSEMKEMEEDYETKLEEMAKELNINKTVDREDNLYHETRDSKEMEVQYQRELIEESDGKDNEERVSSNPEPEYGSDSDNESESDTDKLDESLEPVKQFRKSILHKEAFEKKEAVIELIDLSEEESDDEETDNQMINYPPVNDGNTLMELSTHNSCLTSKDSLYATGDDESELGNDSGQIDYAIESTENVTLPIYKVNDEDVTIEVETDKNDTENTKAEKDKSECEELFNVSTKLNETQEIVEKDVISTNPRGTYFVRNEPQKECKAEQKIKTLNMVRGTYFVAEREMSFYKQTDIENNPTEFIKPKGVNTLVSKIMKSFKTRQSSASSLQQFEQLELAVNNADITADGVKSLEIVMPKQILKGKGYFDDNPEETSNITENPNDSEKTVELSCAAKTQEKRLLYDSLETASTSPDKQDSKILETDETVVHSIILTPKILKESQLYYNDNDKLTHSDVVLRKSPSIIRETTEEYEPSVAVKKILGESFLKPEIISSTRKDRLASKKHESVDIFDSPLSSITKGSCKDNDNFEITANKNVKEPKDIKTEIASLTNLKERAAEIAHEFIEDLVLTQKIKAYVKREALEAKNASTQESTDNKKKHNTKEIKEETISFTTFNTERTSKGNNTVDEFENIVKDLTNVRATDFDLLVAEDFTAPTNKTTQDLAPARLKVKEEKTEGTKKVEEAKCTDTDFELLVADGFTAPPNKTTQEYATASLNGKDENTERTKKFEEAKYNLRHKGKSNLNVSDDKKDNEAEQISETSKSKSTTKKSLRLRRRKNNEETSCDQNENRLKDMVNLKKEFCDVTMGLSAVERKVKDILSPEKKPGEEENVPPMLGIQSCPSKSVTRSRRKLFTPLAEPLEESPSQAGDSNERVHVPRPSYHRARARRKL